MTAPQRTIWRFDVTVDDTVEIDMPAGARILPHVEAGSVLVLRVWAIVNPTAPTVTRVLHVRGTGHPLGNVGTYVGTVEIGPIVWHVFEALS